TAIADLAEVGDVAEADAPCHLDLTTVLHRVHDEAVDVGRPQAGIIDGGADRLAGEGKLALVDALREGRLADAGDGRAVLQGDRHGGSHPTDGRQRSSSPRLAIEVELNLPPHDRNRFGRLL